MEQDKEDGEMSDDIEMIEHDVKVTQNNESMYSVFGDADQDEITTDKNKLVERANRFGISATGNTVNQKIDELYSNFGIDSVNERHFRFDALHLNGVNGLSAREIFEYLQDFKPISLEWVDDNSCNIMCHDNISVALALLEYSREIKNEEIRNMLKNKSSYHWREGAPHPKTDLILMRFATKSDKKNIKNVAEKRECKLDINNVRASTKNPWGDLCRSWGVYDHQEIFRRKFPKVDYEEVYEEPQQRIYIKNKKLAMRLGKRNNDTSNDRLGKRNYDSSNDECSDSSSDSEWKKKSKAPRMRMHADDEDEKRKKAIVDEKGEFAPLSIEVVNCRSTFTPRDLKVVSEKFKNRLENNKPTNIQSNIQSRLGLKVTEESVQSSDESDGSDHYVMSRVQKVSNTTSSVWSRLDVKDSSVKSQETPANKDLRQVIKTRKQVSNDLREKIKKSKQSNLRIEIDNNHSSE